jgi:hypothetical protein
MNKRDERKDPDMQGEDQRKHTRRRRARSISGYEIEVLGHLESSTLDDLDDVTIANQPAGSARLTGFIPDQPALLRFLLHLNDLGMIILGVKALHKRRTR